MGYKETFYAEIKSDYEELGLSVEEIAAKRRIDKKVVRHILAGKRKSGKSDLYIRRSVHLNKPSHQDVIDDYTGGMDLPKILEKYSFDRTKLKYVLDKYNVPVRNQRRANVSKSLTLEYNGVVKTYPSITSASVQTGLPIDFLSKLKFNKNYAIGKTSTEKVAIVHDLDYLIDLEQCCLLIAEIVKGNTIKENGRLLRELLIKNGFIDSFS